MRELESQFKLTEPLTNALKSIIDGKMNVFKDFIPIRIFELTLAIDLPDEIEDEIPKKRIRDRFFNFPAVKHSENEFKLKNFQ